MGIQRRSMSQEGEETRPDTRADRMEHIAIYGNCQKPSILSGRLCNSSSKHLGWCCSINRQRSSPVLWSFCGVARSGAEAADVLFPERNPKPCAPGAIGTMTSTDMAELQHPFSVVGGTDAYAQLRGHGHACAVCSPTSGHVSLLSPAHTAALS